MANFIANSIHVPCVRRGIEYLSSLQMGALPTTKECLQTMKVLQKVFDLTEYTCPFCNQFFEGEEWCHYILNCKAFKKEQWRFINRRQKSLYSPSRRPLKELYPESSKAIRDNDEYPYMETAYGTLPIGYVAISTFLQEIAPQIEKRLYKEAKQSEDDSSLPVSNTGNPIIRTNKSPPMGSTCPYTSTRARPNGMPDPVPLGNG
ncbi:hypothetical protein VP01_4698g1 [Puccinia sorghi]|uniref:Uncharacterized protein n=1 Tax=Puccinia sorghi TaxID=27349 RepID=A0A0L6UQ19_9BASI|nr:hypothetical protein VP01_4698g1 [Puccinia sorghi]